MFIWVDGYSQQLDFNKKYKNKRAYVSYALSCRRKYMKIGIDIGGSHIAVGLVDNNMNII